MKLFRTTTPDVVKECRCFFGINDTKLLIARRKIFYVNTVIQKIVFFCKLLADAVSLECKLLVIWVLTYFVHNYFVCLFICLLLCFFIICYRIIGELEGHSVERMYLRQRCSDGSLNKTILKPLLAAAVGRQYIYVGFPDVKFRVAVLIRYRRKQSGSGIRIVLKSIIRIVLKSYSVRTRPDICRHATFHPNTCTRFWVILQADRQTDKRTNTGKNIYLLLCRK